MTALRASVVWGRAIGGRIVSSNRAKLAQVKRAAAGVAGGASQASRDIGAELRRLQSQRQHPLDHVAILESLVHGVCALLRQDLLVSLAATRDSRAVRMSVLVDGTWHEFFAEDPDAAAEIGEGLAAAFGDPSP